MSLKIKKYKILIMSRKKAILFVFFLIITASIIGWFLKHHPKNNQALIDIVVYPKNAKINLEGPLTFEKVGSLKIYLKPGLYQIKVSAANYTDWNLKLELGPKDFFKETIWLIPKNLLLNPLIKGEIVDFKTLDSNQIAFWQKVDKNYQLNLYHRQNQKIDQILLSNNPPDWFEVHTKGLLALAHFSSNTTIEDYSMKNGGYLFIDLSHSYLNKFWDITKRFENKLAELKNKKIISQKASSTIEQLALLNEMEKSLLIRTRDGIYIFKIFDNQLNNIYQGYASPFSQSKEKVYFLDKDGLLTEYNFRNQEIKTLSAEKFFIENKPDNLFQYQIINSNDGSQFLILKPNGDVFLFKDKQAQFLTANAKKALFLDSNNQPIVIFDDKMIIWPNKEITIGKVKEVIPFEDQKRLIIQKENQLLFFDLVNQAVFVLLNDFKNKFSYDPSLNYLYYLNSDGLNLYSF